MTTMERNWTQLVRKARQEEMQQFKDHGVYAKVPMEEATRTKAKLITTRWVDINKGDEVDPKYRSRLVARELNTYNDD